MISRGAISTVEGMGCRVIINGRVSAPLPWLNARPDDLAVGQEVIVALFGGLSDGVILGRAVSG